MKFWHGDCAKLREFWEKETSSQLQNRGFARVYTPHIHDVNLHNTYLPWVGEAKCLSHKGVNHATIMQETSLTHNDLPLKFFELSEIYESNDIGVYLSIMCEPQFMDDCGGNIYAALVELSCGKLEMFSHGIRLAVASGLLSYIDSNGKKMHGALILARAKFRTKKYGNAAL